MTYFGLENNYIIWVPVIISVSTTEMGTRCLITHCRDQSNDWQVCLLGFSQPARDPFCSPMSRMHLLESCAGVFYSIGDMAVLMESKQDPSGCIPSWQPGLCGGKLITVQILKQVLDGINFPFMLRFPWPNYHSWGKTCVNLCVMQQMEIWHFEPFGNKIEIARPQSGLESSNHCSM